MAELLTERVGMFDTVRVWRDADATWMGIGQILQGGIRVDGAPYMQLTPAWADAARGSMSILMVGLGAGEAIDAILRDNPSRHITVVEIDPVVIEVAFDHFPHLRAWRDAGRLRVVAGDASEFLELTEESWDLGCADAFQSGHETHLPDDLVVGLVARCDDVCANVLTDTAPVVARFARHGRTIIGARSVIDGCNTLLSTRPL